jgi:hypothetical protein
MDIHTRILLVYDENVYVGARGSSMHQIALWPAEIVPEARHWKSKELNRKNSLEVCVCLILIFKLQRVHLAIKRLK